MSSRPSAWPDVERLTVDGSALLPTLEAQLTAGGGERPLIRVLGRHRSAYSSSSPIDELDICFSDGTRLGLVLKDLSPSATLEAARRARPRFLYEPTRELASYRWLTPSAPPGTAKRYGEVSDPSHERYWLFLERIEGFRLSEVGEFSVWERAAKWLGHFHNAFPSVAVHRMRRSSVLLQYDEPFYWCWLKRAQEFLRPHREARRCLSRIARRYSRLVEHMLKLPCTVIHGDFFADNVLVTRDTHGTRICPVDWELTALAPPLIDLAALIAGWPAEEQRAFAHAYIAARCGARSRRSDREAWSGFLFDLRCCQFHLAMKMVGWSPDWSPPPQHAHDWLADAVRLSEQLGR